MILDRPVWNTLATRHAAFAVGGDRARRFAPDIGPLAGARDDEPESLAALAELVPAGGTLLLLQAEPSVLPARLVATMTAPAVQMVLEGLVAVTEPRIEPLTADDVPSLIALASLTKPGPFTTRTHELGSFYGIKENGVLLAMAGERLKHDGYTEVSGVCTHPDARGRGFARSLSAHVARRIADRGEMPYLHAFAANTAAIALYESLGFRLRRAMHVMAIALAAEQPVA
jgi:predicted GNAT family acetyltransferase